MATNRVGGKLRHRLATNAEDDAASLINLISNWSEQELNNYNHVEQRDRNSRPKKKRPPDEGGKKVTISGILRRMAREYFDLPPAHKEVLILLLAGLYSDEVANALGYREVDIDQIFADAVTRLQEAQQGEQIPTGKLLGAEVDNCFSTEILDSIALLPEWSDAGSTSWPRLSSNLTQLLSRQQARTSRF
jgi:DNA-directed RNA polymerase specialized sigma24 family protein